MGMFDSLSAVNPFSSDFFFGPGRGMANRLARNGQQYAYMGANPYDAQQGALIQQLMDQSNGVGPSLAANQFKQANESAMANQFALSRGRGAGAGRNAADQLSSQGLALEGGSAMARLQEQMAARQQLQQSLSSAGQQDFQRAAANQGMYANALQAMMQQGGIGQSLLGLAGQGLGAYAMLRGRGGGGGQQQGGGGWDGSGSVTGMTGSPGGWNPWSGTDPTTY